MFCPKCSEPKTKNETIYCTKCGFDLSGIQTIVERGGLGASQRPNGIKQGVKLLMLGVLLIPVWMCIGVAFPPADRLVEGSPSTTWGEAIAWILMWMAFIAGAARIVFAFAFERAVGQLDFASTSSAETDAIHRLAGGEFGNVLPSGDSFKPAGAGRWKTTDELLIPVARTSGEL